MQEITTDSHDPQDQGSTPQFTTPSSGGETLCGQHYQRFDGLRRDESGVLAADNLLDLIGNTPLLRLNERIGKGIIPSVYAKLEYFNPGGSVKDRIGLKMIEAAERAGKLRPGGTIVEPTSGNTGVGLAMAAALKGYKCVFVLPDKMSNEKIALLKAYGAEVVVTPTNVERESPESYYSVADALTRQIPGAFQPNQYFNANNPLSHYETTGPEIWRQTGGKIDYFVAGVGTGGTISGVARYLKEKNPNIKIVGVDADGSLYTGNRARPYKVEGVGEDFIPDTVDLKLIDEWETVNDRDSFLMCRRVAHEEGLLVGGSGGLALAGALRFASKLKKHAVIVVLLPDSGRSYLSKIYNDEWMRDQGYFGVFLGGKRVGELLAQVGPDRTMIHAYANEPVFQAIDRLHANGISQMPVLAGGSTGNPTAPLSNGAVDQILGVVEERGLLEQIFRDPASINAPVKQVMAPPLPIVDADSEVAPLFQVFKGAANGAVVIDHERIVGIITRSDLLDYVAHQNALKEEY
jgi:cystathionine beta-synthase